MSSPANVQTEDRDRKSPVNDSERLHVLIVDSHALFRAGIRCLLESAADGWSVAEAGSGVDAMDIVLRQRTDVIVVDVSMPGMSGIELTRRVKETHPGLGVLVLGPRAEEDDVIRAFEWGANGYLSKDTDPSELTAAIRRIGAGNNYVTAVQAERAVRFLAQGHVADDPWSTLSARERDILRRIASGHRVTEIARELGLSIKTVSSHKSRIQVKLHCPGTAALIRYAIERGMR